MSKIINTDTVLSNPLDNIVLEVLSQKSQWKPLGNSVQRQHCFCQNYHLNHQYIIKLFRYPKKLSPATKWWRLENKTLKILNGKWGSPITYGHLRIKEADSSTIILVREMISGHTLEDLNVSTLTDEQCKEVGELLANFHNNGIVTRDCTLGNLLLNKEQQLCFIDFGKSRTYKKKSILFFFQAGWDCWKAQWRCCQLKVHSCDIMMSAYWNKLNTNNYTHTLYKLMQKITSIHQRMRLKKRGQLPQDDR